MPIADANPLLQRANKVLAPVLGHYTDIPIARGKGMTLYGMDGTPYLDFSAGIAVVATGHCHPHVVKAICRQAKLLIHACAGVVYYEPNIALAEKLATLVPFSQAKTFFSNSGSEAVEGALKLARYVTGRTKLVAFQGAFHGRTLGALSLTSSKQKYRDGVAPLLPDTHIVPYSLADIEALNPETIAAVIIEPVIGEGGYTPVEKDFMAALRWFCRQHGILLIFDEIQTGMGRTGKWFAFEHYGVHPDILVLAKGLASGMPLGAIVADASVMDRWSTGAHGGTYTGNPVACAAGLATIETIERERLLDNAEKQGAYLLLRLQKLQKKNPVIRDVRGLGLMIALEFENAEIAKAIRMACLGKGLILITCGAHDQVIRLAPPLIVKKKHIDQMLGILEAVIS